MKLQIEQAHAVALMAAFPRLETLREQLRFGHRVEIGFQQLEGPELDLLEARLAAGDAESRARAAQIATLRHALSGGGPTLRARRARDGRCPPSPATWLKTPAAAGCSRPASTASRSPTWSRGWISPRLPRRKAARSSSSSKPTPAPAWLPPPCASPGRTSPGAPSPKSSPPRAM